VIRLRWLWQQALVMCGRRGLAGLGLMIASALFHAAVISQLQAQVSVLKAELSSPHGRQGENARSAVEQHPVAQLEKFYRFFPADGTLADQLARLHAIGDANGLALQQAEYRTGDERGPRLGQYRISVPVTATYPSLKRFLAAALTEMPNLSLDQISMQRRRVGDATVDVQLQFTLFLLRQS
jgi:hypothetical protein